jgi:hypothetical protein
MHLHLGGQVASTTQFHHPQQTMAIDTRVIELIDPHTWWWNFDFIQANFDPWEASQICSLPLSPLGQPDQIVWRGTKNMTTLFFININLIKYKWIFTVARQYVAKPTYCMGYVPGKSEYDIYLTM